ncbi:hypothetical protein MRX96_012612 [Rhipicephalus microplus]
MSCRMSRFSIFILERVVDVSGADCQDAYAAVPKYFTGFLAVPRDGATAGWSGSRRGARPQARSRVDDASSFSRPAPTGGLPHFYTQRGGLPSETVGGAFGFDFPRLSLIEADGATILGSQVMLL